MYLKGFSYFNKLKQINMEYNKQNISNTDTKNIVPVRQNEV